MKPCIHCGTDNPDTARFCNHCGTPITPGGPQGTVPIPPTKIEPSPQTHALEEIRQEPQLSPTPETPPVASRESVATPAPASRITLSMGEIPDRVQHVVKMAVRMAILWGLFCIVFAGLKIADAVFHGLPAPTAALQLPIAGVVYFILAAGLHFAYSGICAILILLKLALEAVSFFSLTINIVQVPVFGWDITGLYNIALVMSIIWALLAIPATIKYHNLLRAKRMLIHDDLAKHRIPSV